MLRPLWLDLTLTLIPLTLAVAAWFAGRYGARMPRKAVLALLCLVLPLVPLPLLRLAPGCQESADLLLYRMGGTTRLECAIALFLLGFAWATPRKSLSPAFLGIVVGLVGFVFLTDSAGRLWWRFAAPAQWANIPDSDGGVAQSTSVTCASAAAAMLLHHYNIVASEGELAYLSNTSLLGASALDMADALRLKLKDTGFRPVVRHVRYDQLLGKDQPFVACVDLPGLGGHALFVRQLFDTAILMVDPQSGAENRMSRAAFDQIWTGTVLMLDGVETLRRP